MSTMHDEHESQPECGAQPARPGAAELDEGATHRSIADDLHALALVIAAALSVPLASEWQSP